MKKLMIAAAIVCAAAMSQAATVNWIEAGSKIYDGTGKTDYMPYSTTPVYLMIGDTADSIVKAMTASGYATTISNSAADNTKKLNSQGKIDASSDIASLADELNNVKAYYVIFNGNEMFVSDVQTLSWQDNTKVYQVAFDNAKNPSRYNNTTNVFKDHNASSGGYVGAGWYTAAVPEPTSGLLLLLGVAGLALKRRRA